MKQNTAIHLLLGVVLLVTIIMFYMLLAPKGQSMPPSGWLLLVGIALPLTVAVFAPSLVRRWRGLPDPPPISAGDIRFFIIFFAVGFLLILMAGGAYSSLAILLVPIAFFVRSRMVGSGPRDTNA